MTRLSSENQVLDFVQAARGSRSAFEIVGGGTRRGVGRPMGDLAVADVSGLSGIIAYQPEELILTARPGTRLDEIKAVLAEKPMSGVRPGELAPARNAGEIHHWRRHLRGCQRFRPPAPWRGP